MRFALATIVAAFTISLAGCGSSSQNDDSTSTVASGSSCDAFWQGWKYDVVANTCSKRSASGCSNPFKYASFEACKEENPTATMGADNTLPETEARIGVSN